MQFGFIRNMEIFIKLILKLNIGYVLIIERNTCVIGTLKSRTLGIHSKSIFIFYLFKIYSMEEVFPCPGLLLHTNNKK